MPIMCGLKVLAIIPARAGSKGILDKNLKLLGQHPLFSYSIAAGAVCKNIDRVIVSTDSAEYSRIAEKYGAEVPFLRPSKISGDTSTDAEFFTHAFEWLKRKENYIPDLVVHLRPTTPLRDISILEAAVTFMKKNDDATSLRSAYKTHLTPYKMFRKKQGYMMPFLSLESVPESYNLPRQHFEDSYIPNGYIDIVRPKVLLETNLLHGPKMKLWETEDVPDIDSKQELELANEVKDNFEYRDIMAYLEKVAHRC